MRFEIIFVDEVHVDCFGYLVVDFNIPRFLQMIDQTHYSVIRPQTRVVPPSNPNFKKIIPFK